MSPPRGNGKPLRRGPNLSRSPSRSGAPEPGEIYIEYRVIGAQIRADAIDAATGVEVTVFGPTTVPREELGNLAVRKLMRRLEGETAEAGAKPVGGRYA